MTLHAAHRDPRIFDQPDQFNILRHPNRHVAFRQGIHHCLVAPPLPLEREFAITTLLQKLPDAQERICPSNEFLYVEG